VAFNLLHLLIRMAGVHAGYRDGEEALVRVTRWMGAARTQLLKAVAAATAGVLLGVITLDGLPGARLPAALIFGAGSLGLAAILNGKRSAWVYLSTASFAVLLLLEVAL